MIRVNPVVLIGHHKTFLRVDVDEVRVCRVVTGNFAQFLLFLPRICTINQRLHHLCPVGNEFHYNYRIYHTGAGKSKSGSGRACPELGLRIPRVRVMYVLPYNSKADLLTLRAQCPRMIYLTRLNCWKSTAPCCRVTYSSACGRAYLLITRQKKSPLLPHD